MEKIIKFLLSDAKLDRDDVLHLLDCRTDSPVYEEVIEEYTEVEALFYKLAKPQTRMLFDEIPPELEGEDLPSGTKAVYMIHTVGGGVSDYCTQAFRESDYLKGMLMNAMSSSYLFRMDLLIQDDLRKECGQRGVGISRRLEAPRDIPMLAQKIACDKLFPDENSEVSTTSAYMLDPPKTDCMIFVLTKDKEMLHTAQDCSSCTSENCPMRKEQQVSVTVVSKDMTRMIPCRTDESLLDTLRRHKMYAGTACGGTGKCGKCRIRFIEGTIEPTYSDRVHFSLEDLAKGMRLACQAFPIEQTRHDHQGVPQDHSVRPDRKSVV